MQPRIPADVTRTLYRVRVAYVDTDQGGVVHHGTYLRYLECARIEYMRDRGFDYAALERDDKLGLLVAEATLRYKRPARFDDQLELHTFIGFASRAKIRFDSLIMRGEELLTHAEITLACVYIPEGKLKSVPPKVLALADTPAPLTRS